MCCRPNTVNKYFLSFQLTSISIFEYIPGALLGSGQGEESKDDVLLSQDASSLLRANESVSLVLNYSHDCYLNWENIMYET